MKKIKVIIVLLFAVFMVSGCSCTQTMCSDADYEAIKQSITEKWENNEQYKATLREEATTKNITEESAIEEYIKQNIESKIETEYKNHPKACITMTDMEDPTSGAIIEGKSWGDAFKQGLLEGLIVYPISWLLVSLTSLFGATGFGKVMAIVVATIIIRTLMLLLTFNSQIQTQKMQSIQAEIGDISNKLKDPNLTQAEKNRLSMKVMEIYKKNGINPLASLIPTLVSFPIFLSVWSAVSQTLVIRTGTFLGLTLGENVSTQVFSLNLTAIVLFALMTAGQILSMKMPNIIRLKQASYKDREKIKEANKQTSLTMNIMLVIILITGFVLPAALAIYWTVGALFSIGQTLIFQNSKVKEKLYNLGNRKKKAKVVR